jgi:hypothetical protein
MPANTPAAMSPENPVANICAQYSRAIRVATSVYTVSSSYLGDDFHLTFAGIEDRKHIRRTRIELSQFSKPSCRRLKAILTHRSLFVS